jgi:phosphoribosylanthranilate isomerase
MIIKVCGITQEEQAREISSFGATHIGVIHFPKSPRHIDISRIKSIKSSIPDTVKLVAVVVNPDKEDVLKLLEIADIIQFHGEEPLEFLKNFPKEKIFKAFRIKDFSDIEKIKPFSEEGYTVLIDAFHKEAYGGTGKQIDPLLAKEIIKRYKNIILSGGLSPENVGNLIRDLKPYGVDASSKLEVRPGVKDLVKTKEFVQRARKAFSGELVE